MGMRRVLATAAVVLASSLLGWLAAGGQPLRLMADDGKPAWANEGAAADRSVLPPPPEPFKGTIN